MNIKSVIQQLDQLSRAEIQERLQQIESEEKQLRILLRMARRREAKKGTASLQEAASCRK